MKAYKLTNRNFETQSNTLWGEGIEHTATGQGSELCSADVIHVYDHPLKASMFNPIHADIKDPILWECEVSEPVADDGLKIGVKTCKTLKQIPLPEISILARVRFAILCALEVYEEPIFLTWASAWLSGKDRSVSAANASWTATSAEAINTSWSAANAAKAAAEAANASWTASSTAANAAKAAAEAARAAERASWTAKKKFIALIEQVMKAEEKSE